MQYSLSDIAKEFDIPVSTLRYYEKEGALPFLRRSANGYFVVDKADLTTLQLLRCLRDAGCSVKMITDLMKQADEKKNLEKDGVFNQDFFASTLQQLALHSDDLMRQQQLLLWQMQITNYLRWLFLRYLQAGTSAINDIPYPGPLPPHFTENTAQLNFEEILSAYAEKYAPRTDCDTSDTDQ